MAFGTLTSYAEPASLAMYNADGICPITQEHLKDIDDIWVAQDGYGYERASLATWLVSSELSPVTRKPMLQTSLALLGFKGVLERQAAAHLERFVCGSSSRVMLLLGGPFIGATLGLAGIAAASSTDGVCSPIALGLVAVAIGAAVGLGASLGILALLNAHANRPAPQSGRALYPTSTPHFAMHALV